MAAKMKKEGWEKKGWRINFKELWNFVGLARAAIEENLEKPVEIKTFFEDVAKTLADKNKPLSWTSPSGMPVSIRCFPWLTTTIQFHIGGKLRQHRLATVQGAEIDKAAAKRQAAPNFVHSCDAAHMALVTNQCVKKGIVDLAMVHDSFGCPAAQAGRFREIIREQFVRMYEENDVLAQMRVAAARDLGTDDGLRKVPDRGTLDLKGVLRSEFAFD